MVHRSIEAEKRLQRRLAAEGFYHGAIDGIEGEQTIRAERRALRHRMKQAHTTLAYTEHAPPPPRGTTAQAEPLPRHTAASPRYRQQLSERQNGISVGQAAYEPGGRPTDPRIAVYDLHARKVYLYDGTKLEAHSGLGEEYRDKTDLAHVHERGKGATPPDEYNLSLREDLFHGVQALRLNPVGGEGEIYGRTGLLAHKYMLGPNGDSNGCVSIKDYNTFLEAYRNGVQKLIVVADANAPPVALRTGFDHAPTAHGRGNNMAAATAASQQPFSLSHFFGFN